MPFKIQVIFRVFDRDQAIYEYISDDIPMVYCIKRRVKLLTGSAKRTKENGLNQDPDTTIFKEIIIDNGSRMILYRYVKVSESRNKLRRFNEELVRTKQII